MRLTEAQKRQILDALDRDDADQAIESTLRTQRTSESGPAIRVVESTPVAESDYFARRLAGPHILVD